MILAGDKKQEKMTVMTTDEIYDKLLTVGRRGVCRQQECGNFKRQLQDLHDFIYVVESTPHPEDPTHSPMFVQCVIHKSLWTTRVKHRLEAEILSYDAMDYGKMTRHVFQLPDTKKRKLLFEMLGKWWFFKNTLAPNAALKDAIRFRDWFFQQEFAYLPQKVRQMTEEMAFHQAVDKLTPKEDAFLGKILEEMEAPVQACCGFFSVKKSSFLTRLEEPDPTPDVGFQSVEKAIYAGDFLWAIIHNYYDCTDRNLYTKLYDVFSA